MINFDVSTPYFVIDVEKIDYQMKTSLESLRRFWPNGILGYSVKTNNLPWLVSYLREKGGWAEVVSSDEYVFAKELGYSIENIIFNGPAKKKEEFVDAVENGAYVNLDSKRELFWLLECNQEKLARCRIGLRVNFCLEQYCPGESQCGSDDGRFGFSYEKGSLFEAICFLREHCIPLSGLHLHCSSKTRSLCVYKAISDVAVEIVRKYNLRLNYVDIGGGFFGGMPNKPSFDDYFSLVYSVFSAEPLLASANVIIEPGMAIVGACISYVSSVIDVKDTANNTFVLLDGSRIHIDPLMNKTKYFYSIQRDPKLGMDGYSANQILCGFTCMEMDRFLKYSGNLLRVGDKVVFEKVGAYTISLTPQFIEFYPAVYALKNGELLMVRKKHTCRNYLN